MTTMLTSFVIAAWLAFPAASAPQAQDNPLGASGANKQWVSVGELPSVSVATGKTATATLRFEVSEGNHVNSSKPGSDLLIPTKLTLEPSAGISLVKITYPPGRELSFPFDPDEKLNVYTGPFEVGVQLRATPGATTGARTLRGELTYQACNDRACFPPRHLPVDFTVTVVRPTGRDRVGR